MILDTSVSTIMTKELLTLGPNDSLAEAVNTFNNHSIRHAPVTSMGQLVGMLSWIDIKRLSLPRETVGSNQNGAHKVARKLSVRDVMTQEPVSVQVDDSIRKVAEILTENEFHAIPVLDGEMLMGIISTTDVIRFFLEEAG